MAGGQPLINLPQGSRDRAAAGNSKEIRRQKVEVRGRMTCRRGEGLELSTALKIDFHPSVVPQKGMKNCSENRPAPPALLSLGEGPGGRAVTRYFHPSVALHRGMITRNDIAICGFGHGTYGCQLLNREGQAGHESKAAGSRDRDRCNARRDKIAQPPFKLFTASKAK